MSDQPRHITNLLNRVAEGDTEAAREVMPYVYRTLRNLAGSLRSKLPAGETLGVTALVNEAYLRIADRQPDGWKARAQFFHTAARAMRDILVEEARRKATLKRGGKLRRVDLVEEDLGVELPAKNILSLHEALQKLERDDSVGYELVMLRYFAGLTLPEAAEVLGVSLSTGERKWRFLRAWLAGELG